MCIPILRVHITSIGKASPKKPQDLNTDCLFYTNYLFSIRIKVASNATKQLEVNILGLIKIKTAT